MSTSQPDARTVVGIDPAKDFSQQERCGMLVAALRMAKVSEKDWENLDDSFIPSLARLDQDEGEPISLITLSSGAMYQCLTAEITWTVMLNNQSKVLKAQYSFFKNVEGKKDWRINYARLANS